MSLEDQIKELNILHMALCLGALMLLFVFSYLSDFAITEFSSSLDAITIFGAAVSFISFFLAPKLFEKKTENLHSLQLKEASIEQLRASYILKWALIEGPALVNAIFFFITKNAFHFWVALIIIVFLYLHKPKMY